MFLLRRLETLLQAILDLNAGINSTHYNAVKRGRCKPNVNFLCDGVYYSFIVVGGVLGRLVKNEPSFYRCYFKKSDDTDTIVNEFAVGDQVKCQTFQSYFGKSKDIIGEK